MGAMFGNLDHTAELEAPSVRAGRFTFNRQLAEFHSTIFAEMSALAVATSSINLGQGFPDSDGPHEIADAAIEAIRAGHNQYPPGPGIPELRRAVALHQLRYYGIEVDSETEVLITAGATEAVCAAMVGLCNQGDEVVLFEPFYDSYAASVAIAGATRKVVSLKGARFEFEPSELKKVISDRTKIILLNTPHNPTGKVFTEQELSAIAEIAVENDLLVVVDEVYEHLVFEGRHLPISTFPGMRDRTLTISSAAKSFSFTGWKVGWATGPAPLVAATRSAKQFMTYVNAAPFQHAISYALDNAELFTEQVRRPMEDQRNLLVEGLNRLGFSTFPTSGTYFVVSDLGGSSGSSAARFCVELANLAQVVTIPVSAFYHDQTKDKGQIRWTFCKRPEVIEEALRRLTDHRDQIKTMVF